MPSAKSTAAPAAAAVTKTEPAPATAVAAASPAAATTTATAATAATAAPASSSTSSSQKTSSVTTAAPSTAVPVTAVVPLEQDGRYLAVDESLSATYKQWRTFTNSKDPADFPNPRKYNNVDDIRTWVSRLKGDTLNVTMKCVQDLFPKRKTFPLTGSAKERRRRLAEYLTDPDASSEEQKPTAVATEAADSSSSGKRAKRAAPVTVAATAAVATTGGASKKARTVPAELTEQIQALVAAAKAAGTALTAAQRKKIETLYEGTTLLDELLN